MFQAGGGARSASNALIREREGAGEKATHDGNDGKSGVSPLLPGVLSQDGCGVDRRFVKGAQTLERLGGQERGRSSAGR